MSGSNTSDPTPLPPAVVEEPSGGMNALIIGVVIAVVVVVLLVVLVVALRYLYRHKGSYLTNEAKGTEFAESADAALKHDPTLQDAADPESQKEYFI